MPRCPSCYAAFADLDLSLDLDERKPKRRYTDLFGGANNDVLGQAPANGQYADPVSAPPPGMSNYAGRGGVTGAQANIPLVDPNAYQYGGKPGGAAAFNQQLQQANAAQQATQGAQIQNQYDTRDQGNVQGTLGGLSSFYQGQLNGTGPSLAAAQMKAATDQNIAAQQAAANSARGSLAGVSAQMGAAQNAATAEQNAANQSMQGRIQEEYNAAQGMQGLGSLYEGEQQVNAQTAYEQAQLQEQQQLENAKMGLGYAGLENQVNTEQLNAQMGQQGQMSSNYLAASGMGMNQSQFNTTQGWNEAMGAIGAGVGLLGAMADADFEEPSRIGRPQTPARSTLGPRGYADADLPAHLTLREERSRDGRPFMLIADQNEHTLEKVATKKLTPDERRQALGPHGAGPIFGDANRAHTTMHDMGLGDPSIQQGLANLDWGASNDPSQGGTFLDQLRAKEAGDIAANAPPGGYTFAQQRFYGPGAQGLAGVQGMSSDEAAQAFGGNGPSMATTAGNAIATGGYDKGWDDAIAKRKAAESDAANKANAAANNKARSSMLSLAQTMMQPHAAPIASSPMAYAPASSFTPMAVPSVQVEDMDLDAEERSLARLYGKLGSGSRFAHLEHQLAAHGRR